MCKGEGHPTQTCTSQSDHRRYPLGLSEEACVEERELVPVMAGGTVGADPGKQAFNRLSPIPRPTMQLVLSMEEG